MKYLVAGGLVALCMATKGNNKTVTYTDSYTRVSYRRILLHGV